MLSLNEEWFRTDSTKMHWEVHCGKCVIALKGGTNISPFATARQIMSLFFI